MGNIPTSSNESVEVRLQEIDGIDEATAREALGNAADKLGVKTKFVKK